MNETPVNEVGWAKKRILRSLKKARDKQRAEEKPEDRAVLTVNEIPVIPTTPYVKKPKPKKARARRGKFQKPRLTRHEFQARLDGRPDVWRLVDGDPGVTTNGRYTIWKGPSKIERGKKACFMKAGGNTIEAPSWGVMAMRLGMT